MANQRFNNQRPGRLSWFYRAAIVATDRRRRRRFITFLFIFHRLATTRTASGLFRAERDSASGVEIDMLDIGDVDAFTVRGDIQYPLDHLAPAGLKFGIPSWSVSRRFPHPVRYPLYR